MLKSASMYLLEGTFHGKVLKLGSKVPWVGLYKIGVGIWKKIIFAEFMDQKS